jgi:hypothetical protein
MAMDYVAAVRNAHQVAERNELEGNRLQGVVRGLRDSAELYRRWWSRSMSYPRWPIRTPMSQRQPGGATAT